MLSSHYHHHKSKTFSQLTQCPFTGTLLLLSFLTTDVITTIVYSSFDGFFLTGKYISACVFHAEEKKIMLIDLTGDRFAGASQFPPKKLFLYTLAFDQFLSETTYDGFSRFGPNINQINTKTLVNCHIK